MRQSCLFVVALIFSLNSTQIFAQDACNCGSFSGLAQTVCMASCSSTESGNQSGSPLNMFMPTEQLEGLQGELTTLNTNMEEFNQNHGESNQLFDMFNQNHQETNNLFDIFNQNHQETNNQIQGINDNLAQANETISDLGQQALDQMEQMHQTIQEQGDAAIEQAEAFNAQFKRSNDIAEKALDPMFAAKMAAAAAIGASLGGLVVNLAVKGIVAAYKGLREVITKEKEKARLLQNYFEAKKSYSEIKKNRNELLKRMRGRVKQLEAYRYFKEKSDFQESKDYIKQQIRLSEKRLKRAAEKTQVAVNQEMPDACLQYLDSQEAKLIQIIDDFQLILKAKDIDEPEYVTCTELSTNLQELYEIEELMQNSRITILRGFSPFLDHMEEAERESIEGIVEIAKRNKKYKNREFDYILDSFKLHEKNLKGRWRDYIKTCIKNKKKETGGSKKKLKKICEEENESLKFYLSEKEKIEKAKEMKLEWAKNYHKSVTDLQLELGVSPTIAAKNRRALYQWHNNVLKEQVCAYNSESCEEMGQNNFEQEIENLSQQINMSCHQGD